MPYWSPTGVPSFKSARWKGKTPIPAGASLPRLVAAIVDATGLSVSLVFNMAMETGVDGPEGFSLDNGATIDADYVSGTGTNTVVMSLDSIVYAGDVVTLDYTQTGDGWKDGSGNVLASITDFTVTNNSAEPPPESAPELLSATVDSSGLSITLVFDKAIEYGIDGPEGFSVDNGSVIDADYVSGTGSDTLQMSLDSTVYDGDTVTLDYTQNGDGWKDLSGNLLASITNAPVTNNSTEPSPGGFFYLRPDGVSYYLRPDGTSRYLRP